MNPLIPFLATVPSALPLYQPSTMLSQSKTEIVFDERQLSKGLLKVNPLTINYHNSEKFRESFENTTLLYLRSKVQRLFEVWEQETLFSSSIQARLKNRNFESIVSLGERAIPAILSELSLNPSQLVWALNIITGIRISEQPISIEEASKLWVKWGKANNLLS